MAEIAPASRSQQRAIVLREIASNRRSAPSASSRNPTITATCARRMLYQAPLGDDAAARYGAPMYNIHRADLIQILFDEVPAGRSVSARALWRCRRTRRVEVRLQTGEVLRATRWSLRRHPLGGAPASARQQEKHLPIS